MRSHDAAALSGRWEITRPTCRLSDWLATGVQESGCREVDSSQGLEGDAPRWEVGLGKPIQVLSVPPWDEMERLWEAKDWDALAELEMLVWVDC